MIANLSKKIIQIISLIFFALVFINNYPVFKKNIELLQLMQRASYENNYSPNDYYKLSVAELRTLSAYFLSNQRYSEVNVIISVIPAALRNDFDNLRQAQALAMTGNMQEALLQAKSLPISTDVLVHWATANWEVLGGVNRLPIAKLWFTIASDRIDGSWVTRRSIGVWWQWWEPRRAISYLESVIQEHPDDAFTHYILGLAYRDTGMLDYAINSLEKAVQQHNYTVSEYCFELAQVYVLRNQLNDKWHANELIKLCLQKSPSNTQLKQLIRDISIL